MSTKSATVTVLVASKPIASWGPSGGRPIAASGGAGKNYSVATLAVATGGGGTRSEAAVKKVTTHPKVVIAADNGYKMTVPYAPQGSTLSGLADTWETQGRPGRRPLVLHTAKATPTMSIALFLAHKGLQTSVNGMIDTLRKMAASKARVTLSNLSPAERGPWRITDMSIEITARQELTNYATRATVAITLTSASDPVNFRGPLSGGKKGKGGKKGRKYKVKKGDTLRKLANKFYGSPSKWKVIAKANGIKKATAKLKVGRVLTIPKNSKTKKGKKPGKKK